jgi:aminoglycoside phosphotransferase (APT) family kinase protein
MPDHALEEPQRARVFLVEHGIFDADEPLQVEVLTGGVSSLVLRARGAGRCVVVKQALAQLLVRDEWRSRVERSTIEARCAAVLAELIPGSIPETLAVDEVQHAFVMACAPDGAANWKIQLMSGVVEPETANRAGRLLGQIHARSARRVELAKQFDDRSFFDELRIDPYLRTLAQRHPDLADAINRMVEEHLATRVCLVHGDYSPKNLLVAPDGALLLLDHEVAHWGNPSFDIAFVLNHLCLKALKFPRCAEEYLASAGNVWETYRGEDPPDLAGRLESETARLLGGLMLARVDGKSPVEYLQTDQERERVRSLARQLVLAPVSTVPGVFEQVAQETARA